MFTGIRSLGNTQGFGASRILLSIQEVKYLQFLSLSFLTCVDLLLFPATLPVEVEGSGRFTSVGAI
jgi:hypothetical protein